MLTVKTSGAPSDLVWSNDGKTIAFNRSIPVEGNNDQKKLIFVIKLDSNK